ncbi:putative phage abortive infection protein [Vibrio vulnificus]
MKLTKILAFLCFILGSVIFFYFLGKASSDGYSFSFSSVTNYEVTGQFGDFVGGVVGTLFALTGTLLIYLTFQEQSRENKRIAFESLFFEMVKLHRDNVSEMRYHKASGSESDNTYENRQVFRVIYQEFVDCFREVKKFSNSQNPRDYYNPKYQRYLQSGVCKGKNDKDLIEMALVDIAFSIVFFGLGEEGEVIVRKHFCTRYKAEYYFKLIYFIKMKPKRTNVDRFTNWESVRSLQLKELHVLIDELYKNRKDPSKSEGLSELALKQNMNGKYQKYYGGHQFRLGHYFRHLYQSYTFLDSHSHLSSKEKYSYGKILRAQLSTYEQALLFINSISCLGMAWELTYESVDEKGLITKYNLITNLPGEHISGIKYKKYYGSVSYESEQHDFKLYNKQFKSDS